MPAVRTAALFLALALHLRTELRLVRLEQGGTDAHGEQSCHVLVVQGRRRILRG